MIAKMLKIILCKGLPASGKSTWTRELIDKNPEKYKRINKDDLRAMLDNGKWSNKNEQCVLQVRDLLIQKFMEDGFNIIVDDTNLDPKHEKQIKQTVEKWNGEILKKEHNCCDGSGKMCDIASCAETRYRKCLGCKNCKPEYELEVKFFDVSLSEAIDRDNKRTIGHVGQKVILGMYERYIAPLNKNKKLEQDSSLPHCIIVDIDGTVAEKGDRSPFDWSRVSGDTPKKEIIDIVNVFRKQGKEIVFFSGRKEQCKEQTKKWIYDNVCEDYWLYMRKDDDDRNDAITKKELFDEHVRNRFYVDFVLDDRDRVVKMWRELGLTCLQVCEGSF